MKMLRTIVLLGIALLGGVFLLEGCKVPTKPVPPPATPTQTSLNNLGSSINNAQTAGQAVETATGKKDDAQAKAKAKARSNVQAAQAELANAPASPSVTFAKGEMGLADDRLGDVPPDAEEALAALSRKNAVLSGEAAKATQMYQAAHSEAVLQIQEAARLEAEVKRLKEAKAKADEAVRAMQEAHKQDLENQQKAHELAMQDLNKKHQEDLDSQRSASMATQQRWFNIAGFVLIGIVVAASVIGGIGGLRATWYLGLAGLACFALAQLLAYWFFKWGMLLAVGGIGAVYAYLQIRAKKLLEEQQVAAQQAQGQCTQVSNTLSMYQEASKDIVSVLDRVYEAGDTEIKNLMDGQIFASLSAKWEKMPQLKSLIHTIRADAKK